ncbi:DUF2336 domain-containing protein [Aurantimonas sp. VKM B-3413]|uniref:DUF2336 domain-containing protein n=1 Tax=Aurantimonas sp. VKM B-3413 TaxID=2779401 RepID=UPI001E2AD5DF|nr:DUF2336 domain-containing protein [Aurantimonas sp. VKM B-3413]MCB8840131.1 DUF2336 domain-containing protein [Aurantimonas sp. VKM B-3413]
MILQRFARWSETATTRQRVEAAETLAISLVDGELEAEDREIVTQTLTLMLDDPAPQVRQTIAAVLAEGLDVPSAILLSLCADTDPIACLVAGRSLCLRDDDLADLVLTGSAKLHAAIATRFVVPPTVAALLAELAEKDAVLALCDNQGAALTDAAFRRIAERFGADGEIRGALLDRVDLPCAVRQTLILRTGEALASLPLLRNLLGESRAETIVQDACEHATGLLADELAEAALPQLANHLRESGQVTMALLIRTVCFGHIDLFTALLAQISPLSERRVRAVVAEGREAAFRSLVSGCGLPSAAAPIFRVAVGLWRNVARGKLADSDMVPRLIVEHLAAGDRDHRRLDGFTEVMRHLRRIAGEASCEAAKDRVRRLAA